MEKNGIDYLLSLEGAEVGDDFGINVREGTFEVEVAVVDIWTVVVLVYVAVWIVNVNVGGN